jgi:hypothetical protein
MNCCVRLSVLTGCLISAAACGNGPRGATEPSASFSSSAASTGAGAEGTSPKVEVCHRAGDKFVAISVAQPGVGAHLAHGDGLIGQAVPGSTATFGPGCVITVAGPVTITFEDLVVNGAPFVSLVESGFEIRVTGPSSFTRAWVAASLFGRPAPSILFRVPAGSTPTSGAILLTPDEGAFRFVSVDLYSSLTPIPYQFIGYSAQPVEGGVNFTEVFNTSGTLPGTMGNFVTVTHPYSATSIDRLMIVLTSPTTACCDNAMGLDNIVVSR